MKIMMLTAGEGTRLRPHTLALPKPAIPFLNVPLFLHGIRFLEEVVPSQVIFNTFHLPEKLKATVQSYSYPFAYQFSDEHVLLGSGGGLGKARDFFHQEEDFILMNGDELILPDAAGQLLKALDFHRRHGNIATLLVTENSEVGKKFGGVWVDKENTIKGFGKQRVENSEKGFHYIGVGIFSKRIFDFIPLTGESNILYDNLMKSFDLGHKASAFPLNCHWYETGNETDFKQATWSCLDKLDSSTYSAQFLLQTIQRYSPDSSFITSSTAKILKHKTAQINTLCVKSYGVFNEKAQASEGLILEKVICGKGVSVTENAFDKMF